jgi:hypothetical protein
MENAMTKVTLRVNNLRKVENYLVFDPGLTSRIAQVITPYGEMTAMYDGNEHVRDDQIAGAP